MSMIGGVSVLEAPRLSVRDIDQAVDFIQSYGYDWSEEVDQKTIYSYYRQAIAFLQDKFVDDEEAPLAELFDANEINDVRHLLVAASSRDPDDKKIQRWACATLKVMHVMAHLNNDLYSIFDDEIREQILNPIQNFVTEDSIQGATFLQNEHEKIRLNKFEFKPVKNQASGIVKLLAKRKLVALNILDRIGVRFVTRNTFDIFRTLRFLVNSSLVSYPQCIVNESINTVYPTNLFLEAMDTLRAKSAKMSSKEISELLDKKLEEQGDEAEFTQKDSVFTDPDYKFL
ncbi:MAG: TIGR04552 family protein, partial [Pseudomonadota bacterium]